MKPEDVRNYEVRIVANPIKDAKGIVTSKADPTKPNDIVDDAKGLFPKGRQFYHCQLLAPKEMFNGKFKRAQKRTITFNVFNSNDQVQLFNDISDEIAKGKDTGFEEASNGDIFLKQYVIGGQYIEEEAGFTYKVMQTNGKPFMAHPKDGKGGYRTEPATRSIIRLFVHEEENPNVRIATEIARVRPFMITANDNSGSAEANNNEVEE
jgi:hypothetical protein